MKPQGFGAVARLNPGSWYRLEGALFLELQNHDHCMKSEVSRYA